MTKDPGILDNAFVQRNPKTCRKALPLCNGLLIYRRLNSSFLGRVIAGTPGSPAAQPIQWQRRRIENGLDLECNCSVVHVALSKSKKQFQRSASTARSYCRVRQLLLFLVMQHDFYLLCLIILEEPNRPLHPVLCR